jgi:hypothetical protein
MRPFATSCGAPPCLFTSDDYGARYWYGGDGNLYERDTYGQNDVVADASADLNEKGEVKISVPTQDDGGDSTYSISATVIDGSRRQVEAAASVPVYRAARRISIEGDVSYVPVGFLLPLRLRVADLDGKPKGGTVTLVLKKPVWNQKESRYRYVEVTRTQVNVPASGRANAQRFPLRPKAICASRPRCPTAPGETLLPRGVSGLLAQ